MIITYSYQTKIPDEIIPYLRQFNSVIRMSYVYKQKNKNSKLSEIESYIKSKNFPNLDSSLIKLAVNESKNLWKKDKVVFGNIVEFNKLKRKKTTDKTNWLVSRNNSMLLRGSKSDNNGNRKAELDILNDCIIFKPNRKTHISIPLPKINPKRKSELIQLEKLCKENKSYFTLRITRSGVGITFDNSFIFAAAAAYEGIKQRVLSIDLNPNYIGYVITDNKKVIHKEIIDLVDLNNKETNKIKYEKSNIAKYLVQKANHYKCEAICTEKLTIKSKNHKKGTTFNRLVNNKWHRKILKQGIAKWSNLFKIKHIEVIPAYSSLIGCGLFNEYDSIAAALELNNRCQAVLLGNRYKLIPDQLELDQLPTHWKEMVTEAILRGATISNWTQLLDLIKKSKFSYRILFSRDKFTGFSFRLFSASSAVLIHRNA